MSKNNREGDGKTCSNLMALQLRPRKIRRDNKIKIDVSKTEYALLKSVSSGQLGWRIWTRQQSKEQINLFWIDTYVSDEQIKKMKAYQKINHIPGSENLGKKNLLSCNISQMKKKGLRDYGFYPATFNMPADIQELQKFARSRESQYYIVKPCSDSQGRGISLATYSELNTKQELVVQEYVENALLMDNMKFDLRIYVLVKSLLPLRIYVYEQGLCRLATCDYERPSHANKRNMKMHLTNYAINKLSPHFIFNRSEEEDHLGHKRSLSATMKAVEHMGCNLDKLYDQIDSIIVKTILSSYSIMAKKYKQLARQQEESLCFEILGFDILLKDNFQPVLLEVNHSPSFCTDTPLDIAVKKYLILDTLNLMNFNHQHKINYLKNNRADNDPNVFPFRAKAGRHTPKDSQAEQLGAYRRIYPLNCSTEKHQTKIRAYDHILKILKMEKMAKFNRSSLYYSPHRSQAKKREDLDGATFSNAKLQAQGRLPYSLYNLMSNLGKADKCSADQDSDKVPLSRQQAREKQEQLNLFDVTLSDDLVMKKELLSFEKRMRLDKKKGILVMPLNSINIRLDQKYSHRQPNSQTSTTLHHQHHNNQQPFQIHSVLNANALFQSLKHQDSKLIKNALRKFKEFSQLKQIQKGQQFLPTNYSAFIEQQAKRSQANLQHQKVDPRQLSELKQSLQRVNFTSVATNKIKKNNRGHYIVIHNKRKSKEPRSHQQHST